MVKITHTCDLIYIIYHIRNKFCRAEHLPGTILDFFVLLLIIIGIIGIAEHLGRKKGGKYFSKQMTGTLH